MEEEAKRPRSRAWSRQYCMDYYVLPASGGLNTAMILQADRHANLPYYLATCALTILNLGYISYRIGWPQKIIGGLKKRVK